MNGFLFFRVELCGTQCSGEMSVYLRVQHLSGLEPKLGEASYECRMYRQADVRFPITFEKVSGEMASVKIPAILAADHGSRLARHVIAHDSRFKNAKVPLTRRPRVQECTLSKSSTVHLVICDFVHLCICPGYHTAP